MAVPGHVTPHPLVSGREADRIAVIDIGSNSVRLVIFDEAARSLVTYYNGKVMCGLGKKLASTGRLDKDAVLLALKELRNFRVICDSAQVRDILPVATAAVRDAKDGADFVAQATDRLGAEVKVLSGESEARFAGLGVICGIPNAHGLVADLGGGSLDLALVENGRIGKTASLPLGALRLKDEVGSDLGAARKLVDRALENLDWLGNAGGRAVYAVGGLWRALARIHMAQTGYPLHMLHNYAIAGQQAAEFAGAVMRFSEEALKAVPDVSRRRIEYMPYGGLVLQRLLKKAEPEALVVSAFGVREGLVFDRLDPAERTADPLHADSLEIADRQGRSEEHALALADWALDFARSVPLDLPERLVRAAALLADIGWRHHPDYRAGNTFRDLLTAPLVALDHPARAILAGAIYHRYRTSGDDPELKAVLSLLPPEQQIHVKALGLSFRLAHTLSAAVPEVLKHSALHREQDALVLALDEGHEPLSSAAVERRLESLADLLNLLPRSAHGR